MTRARSRLCRLSVGRLVLAACLASLTLAASPPPAGGSPTSGASLEQAYKREFAFLEADKHSLQQRITELKAQHAALVAKARAEIEAVQGQVLSKALRADRYQESLMNTEREADASSEGADVIESTLAQIDATLDKSGVKLPDLDPGADDYAARIKQLQLGFDQALPLLTTAGQVRTVKGAYFTKTGNKVEGDILKIGEIAAYGLEPTAPGALSPAGGGRLEVWAEPGGEASARQWIAGEVPSALNLFIYETLDKRMQHKQEKSAREVVESGGVIGWSIVAGGLLALLIALLRALLLLTSSTNTRSVMARLAPLIDSRKYDEAIAIAASTRGALGRVLATTLRNLQRPRQELDDLIDEAILNEQPTLDRFGNVIFVTAAVAPLLGLLGTVTGMIATFDIITEFGTGNPKLLSGGISIALVTTELGLVVAIPALLIGNLLSGWAERVKGDLDRAALRVTNLARGVDLLEPPTSGTPEATGLSHEALVTS